FPFVLKASLVCADAFTEPEIATVCTTEPRVTGWVRSSCLGGAAFMRDATTAPPASTPTNATASRRPDQVVSIPRSRVIVSLGILTSVSKYFGYRTISFNSGAVHAARHPPQGNRNQRPGRHAQASRRGRSDATAPTAVWVR